MAQQWGPHLWRILHQCAERLGKQPTTLLAADETRAWASLLRRTEGIMPCGQCRKHYGEWRRAHPPEGLESYRGDQLRGEARKWLWELHEAVNTRKEVSSGVNLEAIEGLYGPAALGKNDLIKELEALQKSIQLALQQGRINGLYWREWLNRLRFLRSLWSL